VGCADDSDLDLPGQHGLRGAAGNDEDQLRIEIIFTKKTLLFGNPEWNRIPTNGSVYEWKPDWGLSKRMFWNWMIGSKELKTRTGFSYGLVTPRVSCCQ
jgi:hypothetical protein